MIAPKRIVTVITILLLAALYSVDIRSSEFPKDNTPSEETRKDRPSISISPQHPVSLTLGLSSTFSLGSSRDSRISDSSYSDSFDTLTLSIDESIQLALQNNRDLKISQEQLTEATEAVGEASTIFLPKLTGEMNYTRLDMAPFFPTEAFANFGGAPPSPDGDQMPKKIEIGLPDNYSASLNLQQPIFTAGKLKRSYEISTLAREGARNELDMTLNQLIFNVKQTYWTLVKARMSARVAYQSTKLFNSQLKDLQNMFEVGLASKNDMLKTKALYAEAKLNLIKAQNMERLAEKNFCNTVGLPLTTPIDPTSKPEHIIPKRLSLDSAISESLENRPELKAIKQQKMITKKQLEINRRGYLPDLFFTANLGYNYPDREYTAQFYTTWTMGLFASINIFDWGAIAHKCEQAKSRLKQVELGETNTAEAIRLDVTRAYLRLMESDKAIIVALEGKEQADENYRVTYEKFKEGLVSNTELLDAHTLLIRARNSYHNATIDHTIAVANLKRSTGEFSKMKKQYTNTR